MIIDLSVDIIEFVIFLNCLHQLETCDSEGVVDFIMSVILESHSACIQKLRKGKACGNVGRLTMDQNISCILVWNVGCIFVLVSLCHIIIQLLGILNKLYSSLIEFGIHDVQRNDDIVIHRLWHLGFRIEDPASVSCKLSKVHSADSLEYHLNENRLKWYGIKSSCESIIDELIYRFIFWIVSNIVQRDPGLLQHIPYDFSWMLWIRNDFYINSLITILNTIHCLASISISLLISFVYFSRRFFDSK